MSGKVILAITQDQCDLLIALRKGEKPICKYTTFESIRLKGLVTGNLYNQAQLTRTGYGMAEVLLAMLASGDPQGNG